MFFGEVVARGSDFVEDVAVEPGSVGARDEDGDALFADGGIVVAPGGFDVGRFESFIVPGGFFFAEGERSFIGGGESRSTTRHLSLMKISLIIRKPNLR